MPNSSDPMDCSPPGSSVHGILQARILEWVAISFSRGSSRPRDRTQFSHIAGRRFNLCTTNLNPNPYMTTGKTIALTRWTSIGKVMSQVFPGGSDGKASACSAGDPGLIPGLGRSPGKGNDNPFHYSCLGNSMDRGVWQDTVHGVTKSQT